MSATIRGRLRRLVLCGIGLGSLLVWLRVAGAPVTVAAEPACRQLRGIDLGGQIHRLGETAGCRGVVVVFLATECPISNRCIPLLNEITNRKLGTSRIDVFGVISSPHVTREEAVAHSESFEIRFPILFDASGELREQLGPTHTPHAFLLTPRGEVVYDGAVDNRYSAVHQSKPAATRHYLADAIQSLIMREKIAQPRTKPVGCRLEKSARPTKNAQVTFNRDIAPILYSHCTVCHRPGESGPFPLLSYADTVKHAAQIAAVTQDRIMPPWKPVPGFGRFRDEHALTERQIALIQEWIDGGEAEGPEHDRPPVPEFPTGWQLGEPDLILEMPEAFTLEATGDDVHQHFVLPTGLLQDRMVEAIEFRPGNPLVVHHATFYLDVTGAARRLEAADPDVGYAGGPGAHFEPYGRLRAWLPGMRPQPLPPGHGQLLAKGTDIMVEIHYQRSGKAETDRSSLGIHFAPPHARKMVLEIQVMDTRLAIPAGHARFHQHSSYTLPAATTLLDVVPHMHFLGKEVKAEAHLPNGTIKPLIWIKDWDFHWQGQYAFLDPIRLPAGTRIECDFYFDNSTGNPRNPHDPPIHVYGGEQSADEMAICYFRYTCDSLQDLKISQAKHLHARRNDKKPALLP